MFGRTMTHLIVAVAVVALTAGMVTVTPALADGRTNRLLAGLAVGAIIGAAIASSDNNSRCYSSPSAYYSYSVPCDPYPVYGPAPVYCPPPTYYAPPAYYAPQAYYYAPQAYYYAPSRQPRYNDWDYRVHPDGVVVGRHQGGHDGRWQSDGWNHRPQGGPHR